VRRVSNFRRSDCSATQLKYLNVAGTFRLGNLTSLSRALYDSCLLGHDAVTIGKYEVSDRRATSIFRVVQEDYVECGGSRPLRKYSNCLQIDAITYLRRRLS
jgi:hypothetical protein